MMSKVLLVIFSCCAVILASPINPNNGIDTEKQPEEIAKEIPLAESTIKKSLEELFFKIGNAIKSTQQKIFVKIGDKLNTTEFNEATKNLQELVKIYKNSDEIDIDEQSQALIEQKQANVIETFEKLLAEALKRFEENSSDTVNSSDFKLAVLELRDVLESICSVEQGISKEDTNADAP